jgi:hypothetical protein
MNELQKNINWNIVNENDIYTFIPPIKYAKVIKILTENSFTIATKILFFNDNIENKKLYKFNINLECIIASKNYIKQSKDALSNLIYNRIVELNNITINKQGKYYANVFVDNINVSEILLKQKNGKIRRIYDSYSFNDKNKCINSLSKSIKIEKYFLPPIDIKENRPISSSSKIETDCFLSHNWGHDKNNHYLVAKINNELIKRGLNTWFDENKIEGNIRFKMAEGIDNTKCVVVFITKEYRDKVNGLDMKDNSKYEFTFAMNQHGSQYMIPVILDSSMKDTSKWKGELGAGLGTMLYIDLSDKNLTDEEISKKYDELCKRIKHIINKRNKEKEFL